jgi:hypothetical protein
MVSIPGHVNLDSVNIISKDILQITQDRKTLQPLRARKVGKAEHCKIGKDKTSYNSQPQVI